MVLSFDKAELHDVPTGKEMVSGGGLLSLLHEHVTGKSATLRETLSSGELVLTDKRLIFVSSKQGELEKADKKPHMYCGVNSCMSCLFKSDCCVLCDPIDVWEKPKGAVHVKDGVFIDYDYMAPAQPCLGQCAPCGSCCYPYRPLQSQGSFVLTSKLSETLNIVPLPLSKIRHLTTATVTCAKAEATVRSEAHLCTPCMPCVYPRSWKTVTAEGFKDENERVLELDVLLPPWNKRTRVSVHLKGNVDIATLLSFLSKLQGATATLMNGVAEPPQDGVASIVD